jgi:hypothetical protein
MSVESSLRVRSTIIKVPDASPGLLMVNGQQKSFTLERLWRSPVAPAPNMTVDVELDPSGAIAGITAVDTRRLATERLDEIGRQLGKFAHGPGAEGAALAQRSLGDLAGRMGVVALGAAVVLWIAWFFVPGYKVGGGFMGSQTFSVWQFIGLDLQQTSSDAIEIHHGIWALLGIVCIAAPFIAPFVKDPRARFANALPLVYSLIAIFAQRSAIIKLVSMPGVDASSMLSMQLGSYAVLAAGAVLALRAMQKGIRAP